MEEGMFSQLSLSILLLGYECDVWNDGNFLGPSEQSLYPGFWWKELDLIQTTLELLFESWTYLPSTSLM